MKLADLWTAVRRGWPVLLVSVLLGAGIGLALSVTAPNEYTSTSQFFVSTTNTSSALDVLQGSQFSQQRATSYAQLLQGPDLAGRVIDQLGLSSTPTDLSKEVSANVVPETVLLNVAVTDRSPERAQQILKSVDQQFIAMVQELETPDASNTSPVKITVTSEPTLPTAPSSPTTKQNVALGGVIGLLLGVLIAVARWKLDRAARDPDEIGKIAGSPVIGSIMKDELLATRHVVESNTNSRSAEDYRKLRTNLQFLNVDQPPKVIVVSSAMPEEGKTTLVINLAVSLADAGQSVVVVEGDLRRPKITKYLGLVGGVGLTNVLAGSADLDEVTQTFGPGVSVVAAGVTPPNPGELLASSHMAAALAQLRERYDFVLVDAPPLLPVADASALAVRGDGVLLSVRYGKSRKDQLRHAVVALERVGARPLGLVLNIVPPKAEIASAYGYGYGYESEPSGSSSAPAQAPRAESSTPADVL